MPEEFQPLQDKEYIMVTFTPEDKYIKLTQILAFIGYVKRKSIKNFLSFRIEELKRGEDTYYLIIDEFNGRIYLVKDKEEKIEKLWSEVVKEIKEKIERELGKQFEDDWYANYILLAEKGWQKKKEEKEYGQLILVKGFSYKDSIKVAGMLVDISERNGFIRVDVSVDEVSPVLYQKIESEYKRRDWII